MKIAVQIFGHLRTFVECSCSLKKHLLDKYDCDVFIHTWSETEHSTKTWHNKKCKNCNVDSSIKQKIQDLYSPKLIEIEKQIYNSDEDFIITCQHAPQKRKISSLGLISMLYSKNKVNELRKKYQELHGIKYDYVLMIRPDIKLYKDFILEDVDREISITKPNNTRYCAVNTFKSKDFPIIGNVASDIIYFARPSTMDKILNTFNKIDFKKHIDNIWTPETLFFNELQREGIFSQVINYTSDADWEIKRAPIKVNIFKEIISLKIRKNGIFIHLFPFVFFMALQMRFSFLRVIKFEFRFGRIRDE